MCARQKVGLKAGLKKTCFGIRHVRQPWSVVRTVPQAAAHLASLDPRHLAGQELEGKPAQVGAHVLHYFDRDL